MSSTEWLNIRNEKKNVVPTLEAEYYYSAQGKQKVAYDEKGDPAIGMIAILSSGKVIGSPNCGEANLAQVKPSTFPHLLSFIHLLRMRGPHLISIEGHHLPFAWNLPCENTHKNEGT